MSSSKRREMKSLDSLLDKTFENKPVSLKVNKLSKNILISCNLRGNYGSEVVRVLAVCWQLGIALQSAEVKLGVKSNGKCSLQPLSVFLCCIHVFLLICLFVFHTSPIPGELSCWSLPCFTPFFNQSALDRHAMSFALRNMGFWRTLQECVFVS